MLVTSIFFFSHNVFYPRKQISIFWSYLFCHLQMLWIWTGLKFVVWQRVNRNIDGMDHGSALPKRCHVTPQVNRTNVSDRFLWIFIQLCTVIQPLCNTLKEPINPLPDDKILVSSKLKQIADDISKCIKNEKKSHIGQKTLWEKEKLLVSSNLSFSHNVFHSYISLVRRSAALCGNGLRHESIKSISNYQLWNTDNIKLIFKN